MAWQVIVDDDGVVTLPPDLIQRLGWTSDTPLRWKNHEDGVMLGPVDDDDSVGSR